LSRELSAAELALAIAAASPTLCKWCSQPTAASIPVREPHVDPFASTTARSALQFTALVVRATRDL
jgi:hypothetical protein